MSITQLRQRIDNPSIPKDNIYETNATPDVAGNHRHYFLSVPPHMTTARQAIAWTFGMPAQMYVPMVET